MGEFNVKFRGVRGSFPVADRKFLRYGGNTSCIEVSVGGHTIILDAGTGIVGVGDDMLEKHISSAIKPENRSQINATILLSHVHQDHLLGLTFFKPLHLTSCNLNIFGAAPQGMTLAKCLSELIFGKTFPLDLGELGCSLEIKDINDDLCILLKPGQKPQLVETSKIVREPDDVLITFYKSYVHPQDGVIIYRISYKDKSLVYATDKECYFGGDKKFVKFARNCDLLIHDAQYTTEDYLNPYSPKQGYGHSTYEMAIEAGKQTQTQKLVFFHHDPSYDDVKLDAIKEHYRTENVFLAYEGLEIDLI